jgi:hypothetical protein
MGMRPNRSCRRCYTVAVQGTNLCAKHNAAPEVRQRNDLRPLYKCKKWYETRAHVLARDPICMWERPGGCMALSTDCDHVIDAVLWMKTGGDFYDMDNLRGLCHAHHSRRTAREQGFAQGNR